MIKVLFVCLGNSCRSPMAEAIARRDAADVIQARSAGLIALGFVAQPTIAVLQERGYGTSDLQSKMLHRAMIEEADLVVNMSGRPRERAFPMIENVEDWIVEDPYGAELEVYRRICADIEMKVEALAGRIREKGNGEVGNPLTPEA